MKVQQRKEMLEVKLASVCDENDEDVPEEVTLAKTKKKQKTLHISWTQLFHDIESAKDKMLKADSNLCIWQIAKA